MNSNADFLDEHEHLSDLGITLVEEREGYVKLRLPYDERLGNPGTGVMQGGVVATLIDHAGGAVLRTTLDDPFGTPHASTELNVSFVQPADRDLVAEGEAVRVGGSTAVVAVEVYAEGGDQTGGAGDEGGESGDETGNGAEGDDGRDTVAVGRVSLHLSR